MIVHVQATGVSAAAMVRHMLLTTCVAMATGCGWGLCPATVAVLHDAGVGMDPTRAVPVPVPSSLDTYVIRAAHDVHAVPRPDAGCFQAVAVDSGEAGWGQLSACFPDKRRAGLGLLSAFHQVGSDAGRDLLAAILKLDGNGDGNGDGDGFPAALPWLHLGCGVKRLPHWVHIDADASVRPDVVDDIASLASVHDGVAERIYACHVLEHFGRRAFRDVLSVWFQKLHPGGWLRVAVPDFEAVVARYPECSDVTEVTGLVCGGQRSPWDFHYVIFDWRLLSRALTECGFVNVRRWDWRRTDHAFLDDYSQCYLPHMDKAHGRLMSLNVEAQRPW